jgi:tight adherence protein B
MTPILFGLALGISFTIFMLASRPGGASKSMRERLITIQQPVRSEKADVAGAELEKAEQRDYAVRLGKYLQRFRFSKFLQLLLVHADSSMSVADTALISVATGLGSALIALLLLPSPWLAILAMAAGVFVPCKLLQFKRARRLKAFNDALPSAIELMARALRAGHSMSSAIELIAEQSPEPLAGLFVQVFQQQKFGLRFREALLQMAARMPSRDLQFLVTAILVQKETGGDLTEILDRTARVIRERVRIDGEVRTRTAQGRLTGWILGLLPVIMLGLISIVTPGYTTVLFHDPTGQKLLGLGAVLIVIGGMVIRKVVDVEV